MDYLRFVIIYKRKDHQITSYHMLGLSNNLNRLNFRAILGFFEIGTIPKSPQLDWKTTFHDTYLDWITKYI